MGLIRISLNCTVAFALVLQSGCSFLFVKGPPENHTEVATFECSDSNAWPVLDVIWAGLNGLGAASAGSDNMNPQQGQIVAVGLAWLAVSGISAIYGFTKVSECSKAKRLRDERYYGRGFAAPTPAVAPRTTAPPPVTRAPVPASLPAAAPQQVAPSAPAADPATAPASPPAPAPPSAPAPPATSGPGQSAPASPASPLTNSVRPSPARRSLAMRLLETTST